LAIAMISECPPSNFLGAEQPLVSLNVVEIHRVIAV
jgi:hypothetical protein